MNAPCPVCERPLATDVEYLAEYCVCEQAQICSEGHYSYEFAYGSYRWQVCGVLFFAHYSDSSQQFRDTQDAIDLVIRVNKKEMETGAAVQQG